MTCIEHYRRWLNRAGENAELVEELRNIETDVAAMEDRFYRELEFGTGGLRGILGAGTNRMNVYTVAKVTQGYAKYLLRTCPAPSVAIAYDSRVNSTLFAQTAAAVFAANAVAVRLYPRLMPTPALSFAVRELGCSGGIVITASHNPASYNGYKVYGADGCQITTAAAKTIQGEINAVDCFDGVKAGSFDAALA
ncbi:MAG: phospho-sugar mutase, partial [Oscillospiraceae bacterium]